MDRGHCGNGHHLGCIIRRDVPCPHIITAMIVLEEVYGADISEEVYGAYTHIFRHAASSTTTAATVSALKRSMIIIL